jgi:hypothetical protein
MRRIRAKRDYLQRWLQAAPPGAAPGPGAAPAGMTAPRARDSGPAGRAAG